MARAKTRTAKGKRKVARPRTAKKKPAARKTTRRKTASATPRRAAAPAARTAELQAEIRRLRLEIVALQAKLGEVPAITFGATAGEQLVV